MTVSYTLDGDARAAASLLLVRDGDAGVEVLMLRRAERDGDMRSGAAVFPGGVLDARDRAAHTHCTDGDDAAWSERLALPEGGLDYAVAALRETFEEVGLLLADRVPGAAQTTPWRDELQAGRTGIAELCSAFGCRLDTAALAYHSHWLTPPGQPRRFDTRFFLALAPVGQVATPDLGEAVELMWLTPAQALAPERALKLLPVTRRTLLDLQRFATAADALAEARSRRHPPRIMPRRAASTKGGVASRIVLPHELPYAEVARLDPPGRGDVLAELVAGHPVRLSPRILRVTAPNPGPMTGPGTNSYLVTGDGGATWACIDPGPQHAGHTQALIDAARPGRIVRILVTHTHKDHSPGARALAEATGAPRAGRIAAHPQWQDADFVAEQPLAGGEAIRLGPEATLKALHTPGHASNHLVYWLEEEQLLFTGDHVMQGSTVVINPPDGDMAAYLRSLESLLALPVQWFAPGHGFLVAEPHAVLRGLVAHRLKREAKVLAAVRQLGAAHVEGLVEAVYDDVAPALHGVAQRSLLAHLLKLRDDELVAQDESGRWAPSPQGPASGRRSAAGAA
jgi:glyoxylase-like metal-dependent hydrolase (beta-lactamase superfamily II)/8-oxo-dGTP pyrophosphatase MutT (NUDIX family)